MSRICSRMLWDEFVHGQISLGNLFKIDDDEFKLGGGETGKNLQEKAQGQGEDIWFQVG